MNAGTYPPDPARARPALQSLRGPLALIAGRGIVDAAGVVVAYVPAVDGRSACASDDLAHGVAHALNGTPERAGPVLVVRVQGEHRAQALADCLTGWRMIAPAAPGGWWTVKARGQYAHVQRLAELLRIRYALACCGCVECAAQVNTGRDCMGAIPGRGGSLLDAARRALPFLQAATLHDPGAKAARDALAAAIVATDAPGGEFAHA